MTHHLRALRRPAATGRPRRPARWWRLLPPLAPSPAAAAAGRPAAVAEGGAKWPRLLLVLGLAVAVTGPAGAPGLAFATEASAAVRTLATDPEASWTAGRWGWPLAGHPPVLRRFDPPASPYGPGHRGVDLGGAPGDLVLAAGPGVVAYAGVLAGRGVVSVQHPSGLRTTYEPLAVAVKQGAAVARGTVLGRLLAGHAGCPWPACLHWGLRRGETYLDPLSLIRRGPVRLLPRHRREPGG